MIMKSTFRYFCAVLILSSVSTEIFSHDTTHIHPLISLEIGKIIRDIDTDGVDTTNNSEKAYQELYTLNPSPIDEILPSDQFLYWGTDYDPAKYPADGTQRAKEDYLLKLDDAPYTRYTNVIDGVVQEDVPATKVLKHFYQAESGEGMSLISGLPFGSSSL